MSRYDRDRRVRRHGRGYAVAAGGRDYFVLPNDALGWCIYTGPNLDLVPIAGGGFAIGYRSADDAIGDVLAQPR